jgi:hypothetical protein
MLQFCSKLSYQVASWILHEWAYKMSIEFSSQEITTPDQEVQDWLTEVLEDRFNRRKIQDLKEFIHLLIHELHDHPLEDKLKWELRGLQSVGMQLPKGPGVKAAKQQLVTQWMRPGHHTRNKG